jgi:hypothetical protein
MITNLLKNHAKDLLDKNIRGSATLLMERLADQNKVAGKNCNFAI